MIDLSTLIAPEQINEVISSIVTTPLIILFISFLIIDPLVHWAFKSNKTKWGKYWGAYFVKSIILGIVIIWLIVSPTTIQTISGWFQ